MAEQSTAERAGWVFISALAFGVGVLVGGRGCAEGDVPAASVPQDLVQAHAVRSGKPPACVPAVVERLIEAPPRILYECPPKPESAPKKGGAATAKKPVSKAPAPPAAPDLDPRERQKLLAWVRDQSDALKVCRDDRKDIYRLAVWMHLKPGEAEVVRVELNASQGEVPAAVQQCLRRKMLTWRPPDALVRRHDTLVFSLTI
jgi:hypothetical protein